ncbi:hypothetical protein SLEP1_g11741 [Rubroshorea leprosula]|nr:hypothetical protein SLEP1_g11741 [Rubroshorea leprosula]
MKVVARFSVSLPPSSAPTTTLPLTFFDIPWLFFSPSLPLFFYEYPHPTSHFLSTSLPKLKHSLSIALQHFFPFAGHLVLLPDSGKPVILYNEGNSVSLTVAESDSDFFNLSGNYQRNAYDFHALVPNLPGKEKQGMGIPLLAAQVTIFPNSGLCIGLAFHHVVADGRTFNNFIKTWAALYRDNSSSTNLLPFYNRTVIEDTYGLESIYFNQWFNRKSSLEGLVIGCNNEANADMSDMVRATFVMSTNDMEKIKQWIIFQCKQRNMPQPAHLSPSNLTCAFVWVCLIKAREEVKEEKCYTGDPNYLGFNSGGIARLDYPSTYFGNCIGFARCLATREELLGEDGIIIAAHVIGNKVRELNQEMLGESEKWISDWEVFLGSEPHIMVVGSPKLDFYQTDFGWGRPRKIEEISIDDGNAISFMESRDLTGGIEVGLAMSKAKMDAFESAFTHGLSRFND